MKKAGLVALAAALVSGSALAQDFQWEASAGYTDLDGDSVLDAQVSYFLDRVATKGHPLAEAAFLERASNFTLGYADADDADSDTIGITGEFYFDQLYLRGGYASTDAAGTDIDTISARVGWVIADGLRVAAGVDRVDFDVPGVDESNDVVVEAKYVTKLSGETALNVEGSVTFLDQADDEVFALSGDYYFNSALSVGAALSFADDDNNYGVNARYFFTPVLSITASYNTVNDGDDDVFGARLTLRF